MKNEVRRRPATARNNLKGCRCRPTRGWGRAPRAPCATAVAGRRGPRQDPHPLPTSRSQARRPPPGHGAALGPGEAGGRPSAWPAASTTHLPRIPRTDPSPDPADVPDQWMSHDSRRPGLLPERRLQTPPPERERRKGRADGSLPRPGSVPLRSRRDAGSRKKPLSLLSGKLKLPARKVAY